MADKPEQQPPVHPGAYLKERIIPEGLSVKELAERLGVGRPALSNFLNKNAALSPEMAMRFEKMFEGVSAADLLALQARHDEYGAQPFRDEIAVKSYRPAFLQITAGQIVLWSETVNARAQLPALIRTLVCSTGEKLGEVIFPAYDNAQQKGWDGQVSSGSATPWIPQGKSCWELGCGKNAKKKAEFDHKIRTEKTPIKERKETTFVFVTTQVWPQGKAWAKDKNSQEKWKNIRVFDANDIEGWLEQSALAQIRFLEFHGQTSQNTASLDRVWEEWASVTEPAFNQDLFSQAVEQHGAKLKNWLDGAPDRPFVVAADSVPEALAFLACALASPDKETAGVCDRTVVIRSLEAFNSVSRAASNLVAVIASPETQQVLGGFYKKTHTIIVCGRNAVRDEPDIALGLLEHEAFRTALSRMGFNQYNIDRCARESARSPTILRRRLTKIPEIQRPPWSARDDVARALIPLMFAGVWDSSTKADREILRFLADVDEYDKVEQAIARLQRETEPPIWSVGTLRGVISKIDTLSVVRKLVTQRDLENFLFVAETVLSEEDPALELPEDERWAANLHGKSREHSPALRKSICDTLVLMAIHGDGMFEGRLHINLEAKVSGIVNRLLKPFSDSKWLSQRNDLPQYAEAAPDTFLDILEEDLNGSTPKVNALLQSSSGSIFGECARLGLLGALELIAWDPKWLGRAVSILARLSENEIRDQWMNTPLSSLQAVFRSWMPQTAATPTQRNRALELLTNKYPGIGWQICADQLEPGSRLGSHTHRPRWRTDAQNAGDVATRKDNNDVRVKAFELMVSWKSHNPDTLGDLVHCLESLAPDFRNRVWDAVAVWIKTNPRDEAKAALREKIRRYALTQRSRHRDLGDELRSRAQDIYSQLKPSDSVARHGWLFVNHWIEESAEELEEEFDYKKREGRLERLRDEALSEIWQEKGLDGILDLCRLGEASSVIGSRLVKTSGISESAADFIRALLAVKYSGLEEKIHECICGFLANLEPEQRHQSLEELLGRLNRHGDLSVRLLLCAPLDSDTMKLLRKMPADIAEQYWRQVRPGLECRRAAAAEVNQLVLNLLDVGRPDSAFFVADRHFDALSTPLLCRLLREIAKNRSESSNKRLFDSHNISEAFKVLDQRRDMSTDELVGLEFLFLDVLDGTEYGLNNLEKQFSESPTLFIQFLALVFRRDDEGEDPPELRLPDNADKASLAGAGYSLLTRRMPTPGVQSDGSINQDKLMEWVTQARNLAQEHGRAAMGDHMIGQLLSHCPQGKGGIWPCEPVRNVVEETASSEIRNGMSIGVRNARGATWGSGGEEERKLAAHYRRWSEALACEYPYVASVLEDIACSYDHDAKMWEERGQVDERLNF